MSRWHHDRTSLSKYELNKQKAGVLTHGRGEDILVAEFDHNAGPWIQTEVQIRKVSSYQLIKLGGQYYGHYGQGGLKNQYRKILVSVKVKRHIGTFGALFKLKLSWSWYLILTKMLIFNWRTMKLLDLSWPVYPPQYKWAIMCTFHDRICQYWLISVDISVLEIKIRQYCDIGYW